MAHIEQIAPELTWRIRRKVLYPDQAFEKAILEDDEEGMHLGLFDHNQLISVVSLFIRGERMQFRKFATIPDFQRMGYGTQLLNYLTGIAIEHGCNTIWCNARKNASGFYTKFGFSETEKTYHKDGNDFVIMEKTLNKK